MCQVIPFTLPCCRRPYVEISKLPSCPDNWPKSKCPPELCIQIRYDPEDRASGVCWKCKAGMAGLTREQRERLRPGIDGANIVTGLEELGPNGRRKMCEEGGVCWFCGSCGSGREGEMTREVDVGGERVNVLLGKATVPLGKRLRGSGVDKGKGPANKRVRVEGSRLRNVTPASSVAVPEMQQNQSTFWQAVLPQQYDNYARSSQFHQRAVAEMQPHEQYTNFAEEFYIPRGATAEMQFPEAQTYSGYRPPHPEPFRGWPAGYNLEAPGFMPSNFNLQQDSVNQPFATQSQAPNEYTYQPYQTDNPLDPNVGLDIGAGSHAPEVTFNQPAVADGNGGEVKSEEYEGTSQAADDILSQMLDDFQRETVNEQKIVPGSQYELSEHQQYIYPSPTPVRNN